MGHKRDGRLSVPRKSDKFCELVELNIPPERSAACSGRRQFRGRDLNLHADVLVADVPAEMRHDATRSGAARIAGSD
jgi:hypothetical protein